MPLVQVLLGVGSGNHFGVTWENRREEWGMLLPFLYLTYILRTREEQDPEEDPTTCRVVDILSDILYGEEEEEEMKEQDKKEDTGEQENRNEQEGV